MKPNAIVLEEEEIIIFFHSLKYYHKYFQVAFSCLWHSVLWTNGNMHCHCETFYTWSKSILTSQKRQKDEGVTAAHVDHGDHQTPLTLAGLPPPCRGSPLLIASYIHPLLGNWFPFISQGGYGSADMSIIFAPL